MQKTIIKFLVVIIIASSGAFYGGMKYAESKTTHGLTQNDFQNLRNLSPEERQQRLQQLGMSGVGFRSGRSGNQIKNNFTTGEIISKDDKSLTVKLRDGGSRIVFLSNTTEITKSISGSIADLGTGKTIIISGSANQDGSITAQSVQIRPTP